MAEQDDGGIGKLRAELIRILVSLYFVCCPCVCDGFNKQYDLPWLGPLLAVHECLVAVHSISINRSNRYTEAEEGYRHVVMFHVANNTNRLW